MDTQALLDQLNDVQRQAVTAPAGQHLILAGAGSGKTRVLVHRIAHLMHEQGLSPYNILAVTFTNKAAKEMLWRVENIVGMPTKSMWVGTFHGLAHRLLRQHWQAAGLDENFQIIDSDDQYRLVRRIMKALNIDEKNFPPKKVQWFINNQKDDGLRPDHVDVGRDLDKQTMLRVYREYENICREGVLVDFAELLLRSHELFLENPDIVQHYQQRFQYLLIDEFQDTNAIQYAWLRMLIGRDGHFMAVGDDDQSIYGWRGAKIENIHALSSDYPNTETIRLEQNYRSTATILSAANSLISQNHNRLGKNLWTDGEQGEPIAVYAAVNELEEARFVAQQVKGWAQSGQARRDCAILYRSNAQSRVLEEAFLHEGIPYRIHGGLRFFERAEIKDALAYLRLLMNPLDSAAFERIVNVPPRGIGEQTINKIRVQARDNQQSLWQASQTMIADRTLSNRAHNALCDFIKLIEDLSEDAHSTRLDALTEKVYETTFLLEHYKSSKIERSQAKVENLEELITATRQFHTEQSTDHPLRDFLAHAALEAGEAQADPYEDSVQMMTLHSAKGLEFPFVFICGLEEGLFPHAFSMSNPQQIEEERRLCYVGMTRAKQKLVLTHCEMRRMRGQSQAARRSRFLKEIPTNYLHNIKSRAKPSYMQYAAPKLRETAGSSNNSGFNLGQRVSHKTFGKGTILNVDGNGEHQRVHIHFDDAGEKWLIASFLTAASA